MEPAVLKPADPMNRTAGGGIKFIDPVIAAQVAEGRGPAGRTGLSLGQPAHQAPHGNEKGAVAPGKGRHR